MSTLCGVENTTFLEALKATPELDKRDNRGKRHELWFVLLGFILALLRNKDGSLSQIHRSMRNTNQLLCQFLGIKIRLVVSRSELPIILQKVDLEWFKNILFIHFGIGLPATCTKWFACDGKELRGTIAKGKTKGEVTVMVVSHEEGLTIAQDFYNGRKESEKESVRSLLKETGLEKQKLSLDALHFSPKTTTQIARSGGIYLIGLKENQAELYHHMKWISTRLKPKSRWDTGEEKGHGRIESRKYTAFDIQKEDFQDRWKDASLKTLIKVDRVVYDCKKRIQSHQTAFYMSNQEINPINKFELFHAVRNHWQVEVNNHIRDCSLKEDTLRTIKDGISKIASVARTLVLNVLSKLNVRNIKAQLENFADNFQDLLAKLRDIHFL